MAVIIPAIWGLFIILGLGMAILQGLWNRRERNRSILIAHLASVTARGYPLSGALQALGASTKGGFSRKVRIVSELLEMGSSLSGAFSRFPSIMPREYVDLIHAAETGGRLPQVFSTLAHHSRISQAYRSKLLVAAVYPMLLLTWVSGLAYLLVAFIVPKMNMVAADFLYEESYGHIGVVLLIFRVLVLPSFAMAIAVLIMVVPSSVLFRREGVLGLLDHAKWYLWPSRLIERNHAVALFARSLQIQFAGGVPLQKALTAGVNVTVNVHASRKLKVMLACVEGGMPLSEAAERTGLFSERQVLLLNMGESSGNLLPALEEIAYSAQKASEGIIDRIWAVMVPAVVALCGMVVATMGTFMFGIFVKIMTSIAEG